MQERRPGETRVNAAGTADGTGNLRLGFAIVRPHVSPQRLVSPHVTEHGNVPQRSKLHLSAHGIKPKVKIPSVFFFL